MSHDAGDDIDSFDDSPRPAKRQRRSKAGGPSKENAVPPKRKRGRPRKDANQAGKLQQSDSDTPAKPKRKRASKATSKARSLSVSTSNTAASEPVAKKTRKKKSSVQPEHASDDSDDAFEAAPKAKTIPRAVKVVDSESDEKQPKGKKQKRVAHEPTSRPILADIFVSQAPPQSSDPSSLRGPIWIKPPPKPTPQRPVFPTQHGRPMNERSPGLSAFPRPQQPASAVRARLTASPAAAASRRMDVAGGADGQTTSPNNALNTCPTSMQKPQMTGSKPVDPAERARASSLTDRKAVPGVKKPIDEQRAADQIPNGASKMTAEGTASSSVLEQHMNHEEPISGRSAVPDPQTTRSLPSSKPAIPPVSATAAPERPSALFGLMRPMQGVQQQKSINQANAAISKKQFAPSGNMRAGIQAGAKIIVAEEDADSESRSRRTSDIPVAKSKTLTPSSSSSLSTARAPPQKADAIVIDLADELDGLPSDAFASSPERVSSPVISRSNKKGPQKAAGLSGKRQMTLHGSFSEAQDSVQSKNQKTSWPLAERAEKPTHHLLDQKAMETWVYPTNLGGTRDYQYNIVHTGLYHNLLVALPTGLGKTFIAATIMLNWYRWTKDAKIIFVAPTKPLVAQQVDACFHTVGIPRSDTAMLTGTISPAVRADAWESKRVFFMTPQTMSNDLRSGACDPKKVVLLVVDEAHRATGNYSYVDIVRFLRRFNTSFRILALTATPGAKVETVQQVIDGLDISRVEIRTESSLDIRQYVYTRNTDTYLFDYSDEQNRVMEMFSLAIKPVLDKLNSQNATWMKDPMRLTAYGLTQSQRQWSASEAGKKASWPVKSMVSSIFKVLASLAHSITMLRFHGIGPFFRRIKNFKNEVESGEFKGKYAIQIKENENFVKMYNDVQRWINNPDFIGHPKLEYLRQEILNHFLDKGETGRKDDAPATRVMVFAQYRDSAEEIARVLKRNEPMIRPHVFVGQAAAQGSEGMDQKTQLDVIEKFKAGTYNTLVATSIGEEGLDIGEVDLILCYDANASPIRMLQRMGRTGRKRQGNIVLLLMRDKEERDFAQAKDGYEKMQGMIASGKHFQFHEDRSSRILPKDAKPVVDKRIVEIPVENSQTDLPLPKKASRAKKKAPKKFHMPDGVVTGFVKASRVNGDGVPVEDSEDDAPAPKKGKRKAVVRTKSNISLPSPEAEPAPLPFLEDVLLNKIQERELERKYQYVAGNDDSAVVQAPMPEKNVSGFKHPTATRFVKHGRQTLAIASMFKRIEAMDGIALERYREAGAFSDQEDNTKDLIAEPDQAHRLDEADDNQDDGLDTASPARHPARKQGRPKKAATAGAKAKTPAQRKPRGRRAGLTRNSSAMEGASSSPAPTPDDMRLPSQGIALGSGDTSGEDAPQGEYEDDSDLADFIAPSGEPVEFFSSSQPAISQRPTATAILHDLSDSDDDSLPDVEVLRSSKRPGFDPALNEGLSEARAGGVARKRKRIVESDSDD